MAGMCGAIVLLSGTQTVYALQFPWATLGLASRPAPGSRIGLAVAVNDLDPKAPRHGLRLFGV